MSDVEKLQNAKLKVASVTGLIIALILVLWATMLAVQQRTSFGRLMEDFGAAIPENSRWAVSISPAFIIVVAILFGGALIAKEIYIRRPLVKCLTNILAMPIIWFVHWFYSQALVQPMTDLMRELR